MGRNLSDYFVRPKESVVEFLCWTFGFDVLTVEPDVSSDFVFGCGMMTLGGGFGVLVNGCADLFSEIFMKTGQIVGNLLSSIGGDILLSYF